MAQSKTELSWSAHGSTSMGGSKMFCSPGGRHVVQANGEFTGLVRGMLFGLAGSNIAGFSTCDEIGHSAVGPGS